MCSSPTHDAVGAGVGLLAFYMTSDAALNPVGLLVMVGCTVVMGLVETRASLDCRRREEPLKVPRKELRDELRARYLAQGMLRRDASVLAAKQALDEFPRPRWDGPSKMTRRKWRMVALVGALFAAWPVALAYATSRLPDQLEVGKIDHRKLTHYLLTNAVLLAGLFFGLQALGVPLETAQTVVLFAALGIVVGHLWADLITRGGLALLWPFCKRELFLLPERVSVRIPFREKRWVIEPRLLVGGKADCGLMLVVSGGTVWLALVMGGWT